jgi:Tfp pilus assembly protein PilP
MLMLILLTAGYSYPAEQKKPGTPSLNVSDFVFSTENRRNPFEPVNLLKAKQKRESGGTKAGYELEELRLVGTVKSDKKRVAMMEDMQGKGVMLKKGDFINNNLWVVDIPENKVVLGYKLKGEVKKIDIDLPKK